MSRLFTYRPPSGNVYKMQYDPGPDFYTIRIRQHPSCSYPLGYAAHILGDNLMCVTRDCEPLTLDRAKAIALHWIRGFEEYRRSGYFPNGPGKYDIAEEEEQAPSVQAPKAPQAVPDAASHTSAQSSTWDAGLRKSAIPKAALSPTTQTTAPPQDVESAKRLGKSQGALKQILRKLKNFASWPES